jgi:hypothetical protein
VHARRSGVMDPFAHPRHITLREILHKSESWIETKQKCKTWAIAAVVMTVLVAAVIIITLWQTGVLFVDGKHKHPAAGVSSTGADGLPQGTPGASSLVVNESALCHIPTGYNVNAESPTCALNGTACVPPPWPAQWSLTWSTYQYVSNEQFGYVPPPSRPWGLIVEDWTNAQLLWYNAYNPELSTSEKTNYDVLHAIQALFSGVRVFMYQNIYSALMIKESNRQLMQNPAASGYFVQYQNDPAGADTGEFFQTDYNGLTEYNWDYRNASSITAFVQMTLDDLINNNIDGVYTDSFMATPNIPAGVNITTAELGDMEYCMGLATQATIDTLAQNGRYNLIAFGYSLNVGPGITEGVTQQNSPYPYQYAPQDNCFAFMEERCPKMSTTTMLFNSSIANQSVAAFLITRGPNSYLGYGWLNFNRYPKWDPIFLLDVGVPQGNCVETSYGVWSRAWTHGDVTLDCNTFKASIPHSGVPWTQPVATPTIWKMPLQGNLLELTTNVSGFQLLVTSSSSLWPTATFATTSRGVAWSDNGNYYIVCPPQGGYLWPSYTVAVWVYIISGNSTPLSLISTTGIAYDDTVADPSELFLLYMNGNTDGIGFFHGPGTLAKPLCTHATTALSGGWIHVAATFDASSQVASLYLNGSLVNSTHNNPAYTGWSRLQLGYTAGVSYPMNGNLQSFTWANYAFSSSEVQSLYI